MSYSEDDLKALKVPQLKDLLKESGLAVAGKKDDLIQRILESQEEQAGSVDAAIAEEAAAEPIAVVEVENGQEEEQPAAPAVVDDSVPPPTSSSTNGTPRKRAAEVEDAMELDEPAAKRSKVELEQEDTTLESAPPASAPLVEDTTSVVQQEVHAPVEGQEHAGVAPALTEPVEATVLAEEVVEEEPPEYNFEPEVVDSRPTDLYLDTINRQALDFDFERLCSVTLSHNNIYACLCDGKYFQGRGKTSPAYAHSIAEDHHVFINLQTLKVYVLPDGYEVNDPSLDDIKYLLYPTFTPALLNKIDVSPTPAFSLSQTTYYPGFVGLNNIKANSYMNAILQSLVHVIPLRDYFILDSVASSPNATELVKRFSMFCRKVWNPKAFKGQVSPHELLQECSNASGGRFKITAVGDPIEFLGWLLNRLHQDLGGSKKPKSSIIYSAFQGELRVDDQAVLTTGAYGTKPRFDIDREIKSTKSPFLFLALDLPPLPLFQDAVTTNIIPQVPIDQVLAKYNGITTQEAKGILRRYKITRLPPFLILHVKRFTKNNFVEEKNGTIVNFPLRGVDMQDYVDPPSGIAQYYDLVSNVTHSSAAGTAREETTWKTQVHLRPPRDEKGRLPKASEEDEKWFQIQDLMVDEIQPELIALGESYIQIWERRTPTQKHDLKVEVPKPKPVKL